MKSNQIKYLLFIKIQNYILSLGFILGLGYKLEAQKKLDSNLVKAQKNEVKDDIRLMMNITFDGHNMETDDVKLSLVNMNDDHKMAVQINQNFTLFLKRNTKYEIVINHKGYSQRIVLVDTECPKSENWTIKLSLDLFSDQPNDIAGMIFFDYPLDKFVSQPFKNN